MNINNSKLLDLINNYYQQNGKNNTYRDVALEIINGNSHLLLPSVNDSSENNTSTISEKGKKLKISSIFDVEGVKVLGAFTDENALYSWTKKPTQYTLLHTKDVLQICEENGIKRVVINSNQPTMFVLEQG